MRRKLKDLFIYHAQLDSQATIDLLIAFEKGRLAYITRFITKQNVNNSIGVCGFLPLELSIIYDHKHLFDYLVHELNANLNIKNKSFETMTFVALNFQRRNYLFDLLNLDMASLYECKSESQRTLMHEAAINGDSETVRKLLDDFGFYKNLNEYELSHLLYDKYDCTPLYYACWFGCIDIVEQLLDAFYESSSAPQLKLRLKQTSFGKSLSGNLNTIESDDMMELDAFLMDKSDSSKHLNTSYDDDDDVFLLSSSSMLPADDSEKKINHRPKRRSIKFEDSSLSISVLYNRFDCAKMLLTRSIHASCIQEIKHLTSTTYSTELDSWFAGSMKLYTCTDYFEMCNLFHELALNGAKFSNALFVLIDSMSELSQFNTRNRSLPPRVNLPSTLTESEIANYNFDYNSFFSYFLKCLTFVCNYNLEKLFSSEQKCELFLKSCFLKLNEMFLANNNWHMIDAILLGSHPIASRSHFQTGDVNLATSYDYFIYNRHAIEWFVFDFEQFLKALYANGLAFKYFSGKTFFNFLRKHTFIYFLVETTLYSSSSLNTLNNFPTNCLSLRDYNCNCSNKYLDYMQLKALKYRQMERGIARPLSLANLAKIKIKKTIAYLDVDLINRIDLPKQLNFYLSAELAKGLHASYERSKMNKKFNIQKNALVKKKFF